MKTIFILAIICSIVSSCNDLERFNRNGQYKIDTIKINDQELIRASSKLHTKGIFYLDGDAIFAGNTFDMTALYDVNNDGFDDIRAYDLLGPNDTKHIHTYFFNPHTNKFHEILGYKMPFEILSGTQYYFSELKHVSGCQINSDLLTVNNYQAEIIGKINMEQCNSDNNHITLHKIIDDTEQEILRRPVSEVETEFPADYIFGNYVEQFWTLYHDKI